MSQALKERGEVIEQQETRIKELSEELEGARADSPQSLDQLWAAIVELLQDEAPSVLKASVNRFARELNDAWNRRRREGFEARPEPKQPAKKKHKAEKSAR